jgi:hypothetical protein
VAHVIRVVVTALADGAEFHIEPERDRFTPGCKGAKKKISLLLFSAHLVGGVKLFPMMMNP